MISKRRQGLQHLAGLALLLALLSMSLFVAGCGEDEVIDPYAYASLREVSRGPLQSIDFLFEIDAPEFVYIDGNTGIVRDPNDQNLLEFVVAEDLENLAPSLQGKLIGVQKFYSPYVFLMIKRVKDPATLATTDVDSVETLALPNFADPKMEEISGFDLGTMPYDARRGRQSEMQDQIGAEFRTAGTIVMRPDHEWEAPEAVEPVEGEEAPEAPTAPMAWYMVSADNDKAVFKVANVTPSLEFAFKLLQAQNLPFVGGLKVLDVHPYNQRRRENITGNVEITWVPFANRYIAP